VFENRKQQIIRYLDKHPKTHYFIMIVEGLVFIIIAFVICYAVFRILFTGVI